MKLLKPILINLIFLSCIHLANGKNLIGLKSSIVKTDTIAHHKSKKRKTYHIIPPLGPNRDTTIDDCVFTGKYSVASRLKKYPFSRAVKILAVSYPLQETPTYEGIKTGLHIHNGILNQETIIETKQLTDAQISILTNLIYNTKFKKLGINVGDPGGKCYNPRNALLFYDKNGKIFDYLEICFECQRDDSLSDKITIGTPCTQKFELLRQFFADAGIKYGTKKRDN